MTTEQDSKSSGTKEPSATDHREIEWQFDTDELDPVERWLDQHASGSSGFTIAPESTLEIKDSYYDTDDFHDTRKKGKRLRYTLEFVSDVYGEPVQKLVVPLKALQDDLGDHQDAVVAAEYLHELGTTTVGTRVPRGVAFTMGVYAERCSREARDIRVAVPDSKPFRVLTKGKEWKKFERVLEDQKAFNVPNTGVR